MKVQTPVNIKIYDPIEGLVRYKGLIYEEDKANKRLKIGALKYEETIQLRKEVRGKLYTILPIWFTYDGDILGLAAKVVRKDFFAETVYSYGCHFPYLSEAEKEKIRAYVYSLQAKERIYWEDIYNRFYNL